MHTPFERIKAHALEIMREKKIRDFSPGELHRCFKHCKEKLLYTAIVNTAVENGLTITSLYDRGNSRAEER